MAEDKYRGPGPEARIAARLRPSNEKSTAEHHASHGTGPTRTVTTIHCAGSQSSHGAMDPLDANMEGKE